MPFQSSQLLELSLAGHQFTVDDIDEIVRAQVKEDLYLDYKHGNELPKRDASDTIQKYMSAFANSSGGVLIVGVDAPQSIPLQVTGCHGHKRGNLEEWASRCLTPMANYFSPLPKFQVLHHPNGDVLIGVTPRSLGLIPRVEAGRIVYYFRLHDQTLKAPDYLMADLLLGRRQQPILDVVDYKAINLGIGLDDTTGSMSMSFELRLHFENNSIVWSEGCRWGLIAWVQRIDNRSSYEVRQPGNHLLSFVELRELQTGRYTLPAKQLLHISSEAHLDKPFDGEHRRVHLIIPLRIREDWFVYTWKAALYLMSKNGLPTWYQVSLVIDEDTPRLIEEKAQLTSSNGGLAIIKTIAERPIVAWEGL